MSHRVDRVDGELAFKVGVDGKLSQLPLQVLRIPQTHTHTHTSALLPFLTEYPHAHAGASFAVDGGGPDVASQNRKLKIRGRSCVLPAFYSQNLCSGGICVLPSGQVLINRIECVLLLMCSLTNVFSF